MKISQQTCITIQVGGSAAGQGEVELNKGDKILRFIGWLGGFYSRKAVCETVVLHNSMVLALHGLLYSIPVYYLVMII